MNFKLSDSTRILVIGDLMLDHYIYGICNRISPEAPVQVVEVINEQYTLGGAGNVLKNLKAFNGHADIISVVGNDENARIVNSELAKNNLTSDWVITDDKRCTTIKSRVLASNHQLIRLDREDVYPVSDTIALQLMSIIQKEIKNYDVVLISDYNKGLLTEELLKDIFSTCRAAGIKTIVDPKGANFKKYYGVNIIKPNRKEAIIASGVHISDDASLEAACLRLKEITGCDEVVITMSEDGIAFYAEGGVTRIATKAIGIVDVTGAGDTVLAALGVALASGITLFNACDFANHAAAIVVSKVGSAVATVDEIEQRFYQ